MADAGTIWYEALSQAGKNIGDGIAHYKQQQDQVQSMDAMVQMLSQEQYPSASGKVDPKTGQPKMEPFISPEMVRNWTAKTNAQKAHSMGAMQALIEMRYGLAHEGAKARLAEDTLTRKEDLIQRRQMNVSAFKEGLKARAGGKPSSTDKAIKTFGYNPGDFDKLAPHQLRFVGPDGETVPHARFGKDWNIYENVGGQQWQPAKREADFKSVLLPNGIKVPLNKFRSIKAQRKMDATAGATRQDGIPHVSTVAEAMQYPAGTLVMTPVGIRRVPGGRTAKPSDSDSDSADPDSDADDAGE